MDIKTFEQFEESLIKGNLEGVENNLKPEFVEKIIDKDYKWKPIHIACWYGYTDIVTLLISEKCDIETEDKCKNRPIHIACFRGHSKIVKFLIKQRCQIESVNATRQDPLEVAKSKFRNTIVRLVKEAIELRKQTRESIINNDEERFVKLYTPGAMLTLDLASGETWLETALYNKAYKIIKILLNEQVDGPFINLKNKKNQTLLQVAIESEAMEMIQYLIFETENLDNEDCEGRTALMQLFVKLSNNDDKDRHFGYLNAIKAIISEGGDIYLQTKAGDKIIEYCMLPEIRNEIERLFKNRKRKMTLEGKGKEIVLEKVVQKKICEICADKEIDSVFDCGHTICQICGEKVVRCPFCGFQPAHTKRIYFN